jgi:leucyl-tRNA synthetase
MVSHYSAKTIEKKWQDRWEKDTASQASDDSEKEKCYVLDMFPYPSGDGLHVGHVENYTATDIYARYKRLQGFEVLHPIGWDAFGLPAENYAIKTGVHPDEKTHQNIANFTRQIKSLGISYDWSREIDTSSPEYYKWTQWFFLFLYNKGLAYRKQASVNWCPSCQTVLANEQVVDGVCERCKTEVVQKNLKQWFFKITDFIEDQKGQGRDVAGLLSGLEKINWPESTKKAQQHWIGRSEGTLVKFAINHKRDTKNKEHGYIEVFTTRVDTIFGCTYVVVAPEHDFVKKLLSCHSRESASWRRESTNSPDPRVKPEDDNVCVIKNHNEVGKHLEETKKKTELERTELSKDKTGVKLEGIEAINPFTGEAVPVFVADYVLGNYGTGAVMAVPAHDERDFAFSKKYDLPITISVAPSVENNDNECFADDGVLVNSGEFDGLTSEKAREKMTAWLEEKKLGSKKVNYRLRDWLVSRQRYWGVPIPIIYCEHCGIKDIKTKLSVNFYDQEIWNRLLSGEKTIETRALNPEEKERYFGNVIEGDKLAFDLKKTKERKIFRVNRIYQWKNLQELFEQKDLHKKILSKTYETLDKLKSDYDLLAPGYAEKIEKNGLVGWEVELLDIVKEVPVPEQDLPVKLPTDVDFRPTGESPLTRSESFHNVKCPKCGEKARRESDTMDTFVCSSWYYLRFADPRNSEAFADAEKLKKWLPVDVYMGGAEHTVLHLLYARFFTKVLCKYGLLEFDEPFMKLKHQGMVLAEDGRKMSKSLGNVVNPDDIVGQFGADSLRLYEMFMGPLEDAKAWKTDNLVGPRRFLEKVWRMGEKVTVEKSENKTLQTLVHKTIQKVMQDIEEFHFNTVISSLMILSNEMDRHKEIAKENFETLLLLLSPFAPHITEELWEMNGHTESIFVSVWPQANPAFLRDETVDIVVQVNGKLRAKIPVDADAKRQDVEALAMQDEKVILYTRGKTIKKVIFVPNRLMNIVV